ncbi:MAG TPA: hypothetical protein P5509_06930 [Bacteroidales bacterium]|nr:hypothetical protein [Bacteroidales bacterium]
MEININITEACEHLFVHEEEYNAAFNFMYNNIDVVNANFNAKSVNDIKVRYELSNDYVVIFTKGLDKNNKPFNRLEIEDDCGEIIHARKSEKLADVMSGGWDTLTEAVLARTFEIIENL